MLMDSGGMFQAFQAASGVSASQLSLFIRTLVLGGTYCWAVWVIYGFMNEIRHQGVDDVMASLKKVTRVLLIIVLVTILVFIS
jgi:integrating conjugative element protein (TIGR03758 family)